MFTKLNYKLKRPADPAIFKGSFVHTRSFDMYNVNKSYQLLPLDIFKLNPNAIRWSEITDEITKKPRAHRHTTQTTILNFYIQPDGGSVGFYNPKPDAIPFFDETHKDGEYFDLDSVDQIDQFTPAEGDAYLMDVTKVHKPYNLTTGLRKLIQVIWWNRPYSSVLDQINQI